MELIDTTKQEIFYQKIPNLIRDLNERLIERDELSRLIVLAMCSHNHMFLIGERGVAKSMTVELVNDVIENAIFWQLQVGNDTKIEELFGEKRIDESGVVKYVSTQSILHATFAVLDEMFKAKGELLNAMLELLVGGSYTSGDGKKRQTPLISVFGTSNEYPTENKMLPYVDRFLFWYMVPRIKSQENRKRFYAGMYNKEPIQEQYFSIDDLYFIKEESKKIQIPDMVIDIYEKITTNLVKQGVKTSDRKYERTLNTAMKTSAYLNNRMEIDISDIFILLHTSWHDAFEQEKVKRVVFEVIFSRAEDISRIIIECQAEIEKIDTFKNTHLFNYLYYKKDITGVNKNQEFEKIVRTVKEVLKNFITIQETCNELLSIYQFNIQTEELIRNNIFLVNYTQNSFSQEMITKILSIKDELENKITTLKQWLTESSSIFKYQTIFFKKGSKSA